MYEPEGLILSENNNNIGVEIHQGEMVRVDHSVSGERERRMYMDPR